MIQPLTHSWPAQPLPADPSPSPAIQAVESHLLDDRPEHIECPLCHGEHVACEICDAGLTRVQDDIPEESGLRWWEVSHAT